jgi:hypothetical protein
MKPLALLTALLAGVLLAPMSTMAAPTDEPVVDKWVTVTGRAAGTDAKAREEAIAKALREAVEQACGVFLTAQSKTSDYKTVYDKVFANSVGYVRERKVDRVLIDGDETVVTVRARVSTRKFEENWAAIAHTVEQENNPRLIVAIVQDENVDFHDRKPEDTGSVQARIEDFMLKKGITLMDRNVASDVNKRDVLLAAVNDDAAKAAALGARFKADVVVTGKAEAKYGKTLDVAEQKMYQYTATLTVRVIQTDSARILASKSFGPVTATTLQRGGGADKALAKLADEAAPKLLAAVVEAWRERANVARTVQLSVAGMDYELWKGFREKAEKIEGVKALRLREITEGFAQIDVEYAFTNESLADHISEMKSPRLKIEEITANRLKAKVAKETEDEAP